MTDAINAALAASGIPGAVAMVGDSKGVRRSEAYGTAAADTIFQLASMTKAVVSVAAMQLVERGLLTLDAPLAGLLPQLGNRQVITGFDDAGAPILRPATKPITLRQLLTHTSGFGYDFANPELLRAHGPAGPPAPGTLASLDALLLFEPGESWNYGISTDWVGLAVEAASGQRLDAFLAENIFTPLGMTDTGFPLDEAVMARLAPMHARGPDGTLVPFPISVGGGKDAEFLAGGAGLSGTAADYLRFLRMLLNGGSLDGATVLAPETVAEMSRNQIGQLRAGQMDTAMPALSLAIDWFPDMTPGWGLGFLINPETGPNGRSAGSLGWAGIANTYFWVDPARDVAAVLLMQHLPFGDPGAMAVLAVFERSVYAA